MQADQWSLIRIALDGPRSLTCPEKEWCLPASRISFCCLSRFRNPRQAVSCRCDLWTDAVRKLRQSALVLLQTRYKHAFSGPLYFSQEKRLAIIKVGGGVKDDYIQLKLMYLDPLEALAGVEARDAR